MDFISSRRIDLNTKRLLTSSVSTQSLSREASRTRPLQDVRGLRTSHSRKTMPSTNIRSPILSPVPPDIFKTSKFAKKSLRPKSKSSRASQDNNFRELRLPKLSSPELKSSKEDHKTERYSVPLSTKHSTDSPNIIPSKRRVQSMYTHDQNNIKYSVPNVVTKCAYKSRVGFMKFRNKKHNQDTFIIHPLLKQIKGQYLFAVCDGHGAYGHEVSGYIKEHLARNIQDSLSDTSWDVDNLTSTLRASILAINKQIKDSSINVNFSGSTLNTLLIRSSLILCANVGDSRSIVGRKNGDSWQAISLSRDHKPDLPQEEARIKKFNGRVEPYYDQNGNPVGPARVWLPDQHIPGLAMSRSLGDTVACLAGVIAEPEIQAYELNKDDKFIIMASDGIWEFISNEEAVYMISDIWESGSAESCCDKLVKEAVMRWQREDDSIDDITVIVIFLNVSRF